MECERGLLIKLQEKLLKKMGGIPVAIFISSLLVACSGGSQKTAEPSPEAEPDPTVLEQPKSDDDGAGGGVSAGGGAGQVAGSFISEITVADSSVRSGESVEVVLTLKTLNGGPFDAAGFVVLFQTASGTSTGSL